MELNFDHASGTRKWYLVMCLIVVIGFGGADVLHRLLAGLPDIETLESYTPPLITRIYDVHNQIITELYTERRTLIPLTDIPANLQHAFLATEDDRFYSHWGINIRGIAR